MVRKTKRTLRKQPPITRELLKLANDLQRINVRLARLSEQVSDREYDSATLQSMLVKVKEVKSHAE